MAGSWPSTGRSPAITCSSIIFSRRTSTASVTTGPTGCRPSPRPAPPAGSRRAATGPADDLRPAPGGRRELEVLRPGLQPHADVSVRVAGLPGDPDIPGAPRELLPVHYRPGAS